MDDAMKWLPGLVSGDREERFEAAGELEKVWREVGGERFGGMVRQALGGMGEGKREFVRLLMRYRMGLGWDEGLRKEALKGPGMISYVVFQELGDELMEAGEVLEEMLGESHVASQAREAMERIGVGGRRFVPVLLGELDEVGSVESGFEGARALAAVGRGDVALIGELVRRLREGTDGVKAGAAEVLEELGADVAGREGEIVELLRGLLKGETWRSGLMAMASVGRGKVEVMREVAGLARAREPRWGVVKKGKYAKPFDEVMGERGVAIEALGYFTSFGREVVPVLVEAMGDFQEYEADWMGDSEHGRVVASLRGFGGELAGVVPALVGHIWRGDGEGVDWEVVRLLGEIGPAAGGALAELERADAEEGRSAVYEEGKVPTREHDPVAWAIWRIRGGGL